MAKAKPQLLLVDDDPTFLSTVKNLLRDLSIETRIERNPKRALHQLKHGHFNVVVADYRMPDMNGLDFLKEAERLSPDTVGVLISGNIQEDGLIEVVNSGNVFKVLKKPLRFDVLMAVLYEAAGIQETQVKGRSRIASTKAANKLLKRRNRHLKSQLKDNKKLVVAIRNELKQLRQTTDDFMAIATHELRTPLTVIQGYLTMMTDMVSDRTLQRMIFRIQQANQRLQGIVKDLLAFVSSSKGTFPLVQPVALNDILKDMLKDFDTLFIKREILMQPKLSTQDLPVMANINYLRQGLENIVLNAIRFTPNGGRVRITLLRHNDEIRLWVTDTGIGMTKRQVKKIFRAFYEGKKSGHHKSGNVEFNASKLGLGLSISKRIINRHYGRIRVRSRQGKGSSFLVILPMYKS